MKFISKPGDKKDNLVNEEIEASFVLVITEDGEQTWKISFRRCFKRS